MSDFDQEVVKNEPMFFSCDGDYAYKHGGPITREFLELLYLDDHITVPDNIIFDSRVHMLMKGWFPCIPGFHHDDVPRSSSDGQPNYDNAEYRSRHCMALVNGNIAPTEFATGTFIMPGVPEGETIYKVWHPEVEEQLDNGIGRRVPAVSNQLLFFDDRTFHQGTRAVDNGWRWFGRASWDTDRKPVNEIRRQVQVYLEHPMEGW
jgi:hypothetical protein